MVSLEEIPSSFEFGLITPVYKGKGKDPQVRGSYRGITLSSVLAKSLEFVLLERIIQFWLTRMFRKPLKPASRRVCPARMQSSPAWRPSRSTLEKVTLCTHVSMTLLQLLTLWSTQCYSITSTEQVLWGRPGA